ncbi:MAG: aminotransferase class V-fold PLP-dependent enzyme [Actinobacteria bacterium]|nr:aminotransferase class V-fold PLP-dependent enzyme [Actinomycetota bacterium]
MNAGGSEGAGLATRAIHAGEGTDPHTRAHAVPIYQTATFAFDSAEAEENAAERVLAREPDAFLYTRAGNPTTDALQRKVADLEGADESLICSSGMAALATAVLSVLNAGDHCVIPEDIYMGTGILFDDALGSKGVRVTRVDTTDQAAVEAAIRPNTKAVFVESISNPHMLFSDVEALARLAHANQALLIVDNTFLSPVLFRPLEYGADLVVHSATKYLSGHGDTVAGTIAGRKELVDRAHHYQEVIGGAPSPFNSWLVLRGIHTLPMRMRAHSDNALRLARFLDDHDAVEWVRYVGLGSHPQHEAARRYLHQGFGGMLTMRLRGGEAEMSAFAGAVRLGAIAVSLGDLKTLVNPMAKHDCIIRVSVGCEDPEDLIGDFGSALSAAAATAGVV